jgi:hypothetical protein
MSHPYLFTLTGTHPRLPVVLSLCLQWEEMGMAGLISVGAAVGDAVRELTRETSVPRTHGIAVPRVCRARERMGAA